MAMLEGDGGGVRIAVKAVPGASRDQIVGALGDRLKIKVAAPPEGGKANKAIAEVLATALGVKASAVTIVSGAGHPEKVVRVEGVTVEIVQSRLGLVSGDPGARPAG